MPERDPLSYLNLIAALCEQTAALTNSMSLDTFLNDDNALDTAFRCNHDIGEAVNQLTSEFPAYKGRVTGRRSIVGSRNRMSHSLFDRDWKLLWRNLQDAIPVLREEIAGFGR